MKRWMTLTLMAGTIATVGSAHAAGASGRITRDKARGLVSAAYSAKNPGEKPIVYLVPHNGSKNTFDFAVTLKSRLVRNEDQVKEFVRRDPKLRPMLTTRRKDSVPGFIGRVNVKKGKVKLIDVGISSLNRPDNWYFSIGKMGRKHALEDEVNRADVDDKINKRRD